MGSKSLFIISVLIILLCIFGIIYIIRKGLKLAREGVDATSTKRVCGCIGHKCTHHLILKTNEDEENGTEYEEEK